MRERSFAWRVAAALATVILLAGSSGLSLARDDHDHSQRPWLGVSLGDTRDGVSIMSVMDDSPAQDAGLQAGDVVLAIDGRSVADAGEFMAAFREYSPGDSPSLMVRRDGSELTLQPVLAERSSEFVFHMPRFKFDFGGHMQPETLRRGYLGVHLQPLTDELREYFGAPEGEGILIAKVEEGSPAEQAGLRAGDVITGMDGRSVSRHGDLLERLETLEEGDPVEIIAYRDRQAQTFQVNVGVSPHGVFRILGDPDWQEELEERLQGMEDRLQQLQPEKGTSSKQT